MDNHFLLNEDLLWDYADGLLDAQTRQQVVAYLRQHPEWQARLDMILAEQKSLQQLPLERPAPGFADRVMAVWASEQFGTAPVAVPQHGSNWIIRSISVVFGLFIAMPFVALLVALTKGGSVTLPEEYAQYIPQEAPFAWAEALQNPLLRYGILLAFVILTLRFLDQYLHRSNKLLHKA